VNFSFSATYLALWLFVAFQGLLILALLLKLEKLRQLIERGSSLPIGTNAPDFASVDQAGQQTSLATLRDGGILLFLSADCPSCKGLIHSIASLGSLSLRTIAVCLGEKESCADLSRHLGSSIPVIFDQSGKIATAYGASVFPRAVIVDDKKKVRGYGYPRNVDDLEAAFRDSFENCETRISEPSLVSNPE
jgi:peroxiredoxin